MITIATTSIWKITKRLDHVLNYTTNAEKTLNLSYAKDNYKDLHNVIEYTKSSYKTEKQLFVSGVNCEPENAFYQMSDTKEFYNKTDGILAFHAFQSFAKGEVTPKQAHEIGIKLAEEMWGDCFEVVVSTHLNTDHIHSHFVINSVSFKDGFKYYDNHENYSLLRNISDRLCEEYGLSIVEEKACKKSKINYDNFYQKHIKENNYHTTAKEDIDIAIEQAYSYKDFERILKAMDYELIYRANKLSIRRSPYKRNIRIERSFGEEYKMENIKERILNTQGVRVPFPEAKSRRYRLQKGNINYKKSAGSFYRLYLYYCYLLKVFPKYEPIQKLPPSIRADVRKMEQISEEAKSLSRNKIKTTKELSLYKNALLEESDTLIDKRKKLLYKFKTAKTNNEKEIIREQISETSNKINFLREEVKKCKNIEDRMPKIISNIKEMDKEKTNKEKESEKNEHIR